MSGLPLRDDSPRMQYRSRPVSVAVDPVSLVISECISITSAIQKHARSPHSSVSAILGGNPNPILLGPPNLAPRSHSKSPSEGTGADGTEDVVTTRWGLRGQKGKSMQDNPLITGFSKLRYDIAGVKGPNKVLPLYQRIADALVRHSFLRRPFAPYTISPHDTDQGNRRTDNYSGLGSSPKVSRIWLYQPRVTEVRLGYAVSFGCCDTLPV